MRSQMYEITFTGQAGRALRAELDDCEVTLGPGTTILYADLLDQAALTGLMQRLSGLGLEVIEFHRVDPLPGAVTTTVIKGAYPVRWTGAQAVVTLPEHIDVSNATQISEQLLSLINRGAAALIADMTATASCDYAGADAVGRAYQRALASGTRLRLVVTAQIVRRVLGVNGLDRLIPVYPSLEAAVAAAEPAAADPIVPKQGDPHAPLHRKPG